MGKGVPQKVLSANATLTTFDTEIVRKVEEGDAFSPLFKTMPKPDGAGRRFNFALALGRNVAYQRSPGSPRKSFQRSQEEVFIDIPDKFSAPYEIPWEDVDESRFSELSLITDEITQGMLAARNKYLGSFIQAGAAQNAGTPANPAATTDGSQTAHWINANDTMVLPPNGENTFAAGHTHIETANGGAVSAQRFMTAIKKQITEHGYGTKGTLSFVNIQEENSIIALATTVQQNQTMDPATRETFLRAGNISAVDGWLGLRFMRSNWVYPGVIPSVDLEFAGLPGGGAMRFVERELSYRTSINENEQTIIAEADEMYGAGIRHKAAGCVIKVA